MPDTNTKPVARDAHTSVNLEINGRPVTARKGEMIISVADRYDIRIPRFCYHKKLSIAANCRMCLVEVEKAPKPVPACAFPVADGMKVHTQSRLAIDAQKGTMEFLLINHPLDCPICDQGGECELQDVAMGYGEDVSRYNEKKRVVRDKNIGPLISTDMTRCIHCTRCVRFGEEIAGVRELGATGRGEFMEIGTYIEKAMTSELSGNVIDVCPVGALNAKPSRYSGRSWEMVQHALIAPHDSVGSHLYLHTLRGRAMRVVPREDESLNETWISDRDRFSYQALASKDRLLAPMVKHAGQWEVTDWEQALQAVADGLRQQAPDDIGILTAPNATLEELYLMRKIARGLGTDNIDHRLRQCDFSDQAAAPLFPWLGQAVPDLEWLDAALLIGSDTRREQPIIAHRLRKAAVKGARIMALNPRQFGFSFDLAGHVVRAPADMAYALAGVAKTVLEKANVDSPPPLREVLASAEPDEDARAIAEELAVNGQKAILLGGLAAAHPQFSLLRALASVIADHTGSRFGYLPEAANTAGAWLAGVVPHRLPGGKTNERPGMHARAMLEAPRKAYLLFGMEPEFDCDDPARARAAMDQSAFVAVCSPFASDAMREYADVLLPVAAFAETAGTFVNLEGRWQSWNQAANAPGETRQGWKVLRVLGNNLSLHGFDYVSAEQVRDELKARFAAELEFDNALTLQTAFSLTRPAPGLTRAADVPMYALDAVVRRAEALQATPHAKPAACYLDPRQAETLLLNGVGRVRVSQGENEAILPLVLDETVPLNVAWIPAGLESVRTLGAAFGDVVLERA
ncbi:MAG: NADH-quinone oxidoreductase subunit G [Gammaproteobacteria bacterium]|nr:NADH-quinone oxidoreductase subunit G [Gammaproteobacteria bacterium]